MVVVHESIYMWSKMEEEEEDNWTTLISLRAKSNQVGIYLILSERKIER